MGGAGLGTSTDWMRRTGNSLGPLPLLHCCRKRKKAQQVLVEFPAKSTDRSLHICRHVEVPLCFHLISDRPPHTDLALTHLQVRKMSLFLVRLHCLVYGRCWLGSTFLAQTDGDISLSLCTQAETPLFVLFSSRLSKHTWAGKQAVH